MKKNRILSTAGLDPSNSTRLRSYCKLMQVSLTDKWLFADEFVSSHVCFVCHDYLVNLHQSVLNRSQIIVVVDVADTHNSDDKYRISIPLSASKIKELLNKISRDVKFTTLNLKAEDPKKTVNIFNAAFTKIRSNFFEKKDRNIIEINQKRRQEFISYLTQKIQINKKIVPKVVLLGSPGSGKTTIVQTASQGCALKSDVSATDSVARDKLQTTVGIDYAEIQMGGVNTTPNCKLKLFGTPGQIKFNFVWDMVGKNAEAFIVLLDMSRPEPLAYLIFYMKFLKSELGKVSNIYCALTHCSKYKGSIINFIDSIEYRFPKFDGLYFVDSREKEDVCTMLEHIYPQISQ